MVEVIRILLVDDHPLVRGYLLKGADEAEVLRAVHAVAHGEAISSPVIARRLIQFFANVRPVLPAHLFPELTDRSALATGEWSVVASTAGSSAAFGRRC